VLGNTLPCVPTQASPRRASMEGNLLQDAIAGDTPPGAILSGARLGCAPRHEGGRGPALEHRFVAPSRVVGAIARDLPDRIGNLVEQRGQRLAVVNAAPSEVHRDNLFRGLINPQVELAPRAPAADTMLPHVPFFRAVDSQSGRINHDMPRATLRQSR